MPSKESQPSRKLQISKPPQSEVKEQRNRLLAILILCTFVFVIIGYYCSNNSILEKNADMMRERPYLSNFAWIFDENIRTIAGYAIVFLGLFVLAPFFFGGLLTQYAYRHLPDTWQYGHLNLGIYSGNMSDLIFVVAFLVTIGFFYVLAQFIAKWGVIKLDNRKVGLIVVGYMLVLLLLSFVFSGKTYAPVNSLWDCQSRIGLENYICYSKVDRANFSALVWDPQHCGPSGCSFVEKQINPACSNYLKGTEMYVDESHFRCGPEPDNVKIAYQSLCYVLVSVDNRCRISDTDWNSSGCGLNGCLIYPNSSVRAMCTIDGGPLDGTAWKIDETHYSCGPSLHNYGTCWQLLMNSTPCYDSKGKGVNYDCGLQGCAFKDYAIDPSCSIFFVGTSWYKDETHFTCGQFPFYD